EARGDQHGAIRHPVEEAGLPVVQIATDALSERRVACRHALEHEVAALPAERAGRTLSENCRRGSDGESENGERRQGSPGRSTWVGGTHFCYGARNAHADESRR